MESDDNIASGVAHHLHPEEPLPSTATAARFLEHIGVEVSILHEQPNAGRTLIMKFQEVAAGADFAVVLVTPDDVGGLNEGNLKPRARQNVIFELGFFIGKLGANKVCALVARGVEKPPDFDGVVYVLLESGYGWKLELARELKAAGIGTVRAFGLSDQPCQGRSGRCTLGKYTFYTIGTVTSTPSSRILTRRASKNTNA